MSNSSDGEDTVDTAGVIFLVRIIGSFFSFYSVDPSFAFLHLFEDYSNLGDDDGKDPHFPLTVVRQCEFTLPDEGVFAGRPVHERTFTEFHPLQSDHRNFIIRMLESIRLQLIH